jgi:HPt (histidine-containing phosphotransfer) domain-containing protein
VQDATLFDEAAALRFAGGDRRLLKQVVALFRSDSAARLRAIERAIRRHDGEALRVAAHTLKGAVAAVGANARQQVSHASGAGLAGPCERACRRGRTKP